MATETTPESGDSSPQIFAMRPKHWQELDAEQRVGRMRGEVKLLKSRVRTLEETVRALQYHSHNGDSIVVPLHSALSSSENSVPGMEGEYF